MDAISDARVVHTVSSTWSDGYVPHTALRMYPYPMDPPSLIPLERVFRCFDPACVWSAYGFYRFGDFHKHIVECHPECDTTIAESSVQKTSATTPPENSCSPSSEGRGSSDIGPRFVQVSFDEQTGRKRKDDRPAGFRKRTCKVSDGAKENIKIVRENGGACLRCKVLKKQCDASTPCKSCPQQDDNTKGDYWKVLGCQRMDDNVSTRFIGILLPDKIGGCAMNPWAMFDKNSILSIEPKIILEAFEIIYPKSTPLSELIGSYSQYYTSLVTQSGEEDGRLPVDYAAYLGLCGAAQLHVVDGPTGSVHVPRLSIIALTNSVPEFSWLGGYGFGSLGLAMSILNCRKGLRGGSPSEGGIENCTTGNPCSCENVSTSVYYLTNNALEWLLWCRVLGRKKLHPRLWLDTFIYLCYFGTLRSVLIDLQTKFAAGRQDPNAKTSAALRIQSLYAALVSIFYWASDGDALSVEDKNNAEISEYGIESLSLLKKAVQHDRWKERGIMNSKDFLMGLGTGFYSDGTYKGFYVQQYGLESHREALASNLRKKRDSLPPEPVGSSEL